MCEGRPPKVDAFMHLNRQREPGRISSALSIGGYMQPWAEHFYKSPAWKHTRLSYLKSVGCLCERCLAKGLYVPAVYVHHKTYLTQANIDDPNISLSWENLEALCEQCHKDEHMRAERRYTVAEDGTVIVK